MSIEISGISEDLKNECINAFKTLLQDNGFDINSRLSALQKVARKGEFSDDELRYMELKDFASLKRENMKENREENKPNFKSQNHPKNREYNPNSSHKADFYKDKNDSGFNSLKDAFAKFKNPPKK